MLKITTMTLGDYGTNCYVLREENNSHCCIIDPGYEVERILQFLEKNRLTLDAILLTHGHFDHVGAVAALAAETDCRVYISQADLGLPPMITNGRLFYTDTYDAGGEVKAAGMTFRVIPTPGIPPARCVCLRRM